MHEKINTYPNLQKIFYQYKYPILIGGTDTDTESAKSRLDLARFLQKRLSENTPIDTSNTFVLRQIAENIHYAKLKKKFLEEEIPNGRSSLLIRNEYNLIKNDIDVIKAIAYTEGGSIALSLAGDVAKDNKELVLYLVNLNGNALQYASPRLLENKEIVLRAVTSVPDSLLYASYELRDDPEIIKTALEQSGDSIKYASDRLQDNKELILLSIQSEGFFRLGKLDKETYMSISDRLKQDEDVFSTLIEFSGEIDSSLAEEAKEHNYEVFKALTSDEPLLNNKKIILAGLIKFGRFLNIDFDINLLNDKDFLKKMIWNDTYPNLPFLNFYVEKMGPFHINDIEIAILSIMKYGRDAVAMISEALRSEFKPYLDEEGEARYNFDFCKNQLEKVQKQVNSGKYNFI